MSEQTGGAPDGRSATSIDALVLDVKDNVATVLRAVDPGELIHVRTATGEIQLAVLERVPLCHKLALADLAEGDIVYKYGEPIGRMTRAVGAGGHVHVHSMRSNRARLEPEGAQPAAAPAG